MCRPQQSLKKESAYFKGRPVFLAAFKGIEPPKLPEQLSKKEQKQGCLRAQSLLKSAPFRLAGFGVKLACLLAQFAIAK